MAVKKSGNIAHEQLATNLRFGFKKLLSGLLVSSLLFCVSILLLHSHYSGKLKNLYIPKIVQVNGQRKLLTFEGSGLFEPKPPGPGREKMIKSGLYYILIKGNDQYKKLVSGSRKIPASSAGKLFGFWSLLGDYFITLFQSPGPGQPQPAPAVEKGTAYKIGDKALRFTLGDLISPNRKISVENELREFFSSPETEKDRYFSVLNQVFNGRILAYRRGFKKSISWSFLIFPCFTLMWLWLLRKYSGKKVRDEFIRGSKILKFETFKAEVEKSESERIAKLIKGKSPEELERIERVLKKPGFKIADLQIPRFYEPTHFLITGTTGSGKSVLLNQVLDQIYNRKEKCIIYDPKGEFYSKHGRPEDLIFYPFDQRCLKYSIMNEIEAMPDFHMIANSIVQPPEDRPKDDNKYFYSTAANILATSMMQLHRLGKSSTKDLIEFINQQMDRIRNEFLEIPSVYRSALKHLEHDAKPANSIISTMIDCTSFLIHMLHLQGDFSFRRFIRDRSDTRNLYIFNKDNYSEIFRPLMSFVLDVIIREILSMQDTQEDERIFIVIDELDSLGRILSLLRGLKQGRSKGLSMIIATQDYGGFEMTYGKPNLKSFINNINLGWILRINEPETSKYISSYLGDREILKKQDSRSMSPADMGDRQTISEVDKIENIVLPSEFQSIKNFQSFFKISNIGLTKFQIPEIFYPKRNPDFLLDEAAFSIKDKLLEQNEAQQEQATRAELSPAQTKESSSIEASEAKPIWKI